MVFAAVKTFINFFSRLFRAGWRSGSCRSLRQHSCHKNFGQGRGGGVVDPVIILLSCDYKNESATATSYW